MDKILDKPEVSVIVTAYNAEKWIDQCITSIQKQTYTSWELILVNDGSSDSTLNIMLKYASIDRRIIIINKLNTGVADSRNLAIKISKGSWVAILDSDDIADENRLLRQLSLIVNDDSVVLVASNSKSIDSNNKIIKENYYPKSSKKLKQNLFKVKRFPPHSSMFYRKTTLIRVGCFRPEFEQSEDFDLWVRLSVIGEFKLSPEKLIHYRVHNNQLSEGDGILKQYFYAYLALSLNNIFIFLKNNGKKEDIDISMYKLFFFDCLSKSKLKQNIEQFIDFKRKYRSTSSLFNKIKLLLINNNIVNYLTIHNKIKHFSSKIETVYINKNLI